MSEWKEYKLGDLVKFGNGKSRPKNNGEYAVYGGNGILGFSDEKNYDAETIIIGRVGAYCGSVYYENKPIWVSDNALAAKPRNNYHTKFLYYFLKNLHLNDFAEGSSHPLVTQALLNSIEIKITDNIREQKSIAAVLSSLDDKIDLLHRQNATLEAMAEALFKQWFVVEAREAEASTQGNTKFKSGTFELWIKETVGGEWGKENIEGEFSKPVNCIRGTDIADLNNGLPEKTPVRFIKEKKFEAIEPKSGDIIIETSGGTETQSTGRVTYINDDIKSLFNYPIIFSNFCRLLRIKKPVYSFFVYLFLRNLYNQDEFFNLENGSSGIKNLDYKALLFELEYPMPDEKLILGFNQEVEGYFKKINSNKRQIRTLTNLRDTLLPKLMSGEVRVAG
jgi:type I restriction enzyme, S subunit